MCATRLCIQLHTVEGCKKGLTKGLIVFAKCGDARQRFPVCESKSVTGAFFWKSAVYFVWRDDLIVHWHVFHYDGYRESLIGDCRVPIRPLFSTPHMAFACKRVRLDQRPYIHLCFSAEIIPRPRLPDGSLAKSVLKQPEFITSPSPQSDAPLFCDSAGKSKGPSIWVGFPGSPEAKGGT